MAYKDYGNFVRPSEVCHSYLKPTLSGEEARKLYLEEVKDAENPSHSSDNRCCTKKSNKNNISHDNNLTANEIFLAAQCNDKDSIQKALDSNPDNLYIVDNYGWSLLMIACQANSVDVVKELLNRGIDTSIQDKAGNTARSLVIKNKNIALATILLEHKSSHPSEQDTKEKYENESSSRKESFMCKICDKTFPDDKQDHLSSTLHNINASKGRKIPVNYAIPESNRGYQIMLKVGWDKESGLGRDGSGKIYPIKAVQKKDRKGLGLLKKEEKLKAESEKHVNRKTFKTYYHKNRKMEINFRREFY